MLLCRNGLHLRNCSTWQCSGMFKCPDSYCVPLRSVCDGTRDCAEGEDEINCENRTCPGMLRCRRGACLHQSDVCDGTVHCPLADDELMCGLVTCPQACTCSGHAVDCSSDDDLDRMPTVSVETKVLILSSNGSSFSWTTATLPKLLRLNLSGNKIQQLKADHFRG